MGERELRTKRVIFVNRVYMYMHARIHTRIHTRTRIHTPIRHFEEEWFEFVWTHDMRGV